jgi:hypothetical protein
MADTKISALTASTTPLAGTEVLPIVQSGTTKKVAVSDLTAGRAVSMLSSTAGNIQASGNTIASTNTDGNVNLAPNGYGEVVIPNSADADAKLVLSGYGAGGDPYVRGYDRSGALNFNLVCDTDPNSRAFTFYGNVVIGTSGKGIDFSATPGTGTSELLNDYEEGTFTPTWNGGTVTVNNSNYTKVGRQVTWVIDVTFGASVTVANSQLTLPFTATGTWGGGAINYTDYSATASVSVDSAANRLLFRSAINGGNVNCIDVATKRFVCVVSYFA